MGLVFACSEITGFSVDNGTPVEDTTAASFNAAQSRVSMRCDGIGVGVASDQFVATLPSDLATAHISFFLYTTVADGDSSSPYIELRESDGTGILRLIAIGNGGEREWQYYDGATWVRIGNRLTNTGLVKFDIAITTGASGTVTIHQDGAETHSGSIGSATGSIDNLRFGHVDNNGASYFSEIAVSDDTSLLGVIAETEAPTGAGTDSDGTGGFADIDEAVSDSGATLLSLAAGGDRNGFTSPARTGFDSFDDVLGVSVAASMRREASGPQSARFYLLIDSTYYYSDTFALTTSYAPYQYVWTQNPDTAAAWTKTDAESASLEWGIEAVT